MVALGSTLGFRPTLGIPCAGKSFAKHDFFQQMSGATSSRRWESSAQHHCLGCAPTEPLGWSWARWGTQSCPVLCHGSPEAQAEMKLNRAWSKGSLILAQAQSKGVYF